MRTKVHSIGPSEKVPGNFVKKWGGKWGHPAKDKNGKVIGYVEFMPNSCDDNVAEEQFQEALKTFVRI